MGPLFAVALRLHREVQLVGQGEARQRQVHALGFFQGDTHVLDEVFDEEARLEIALDDARAEVVQRPARRRAAADRLQDGFEVQTRLVAVQQGLAHTDHVGGDEDLIDHLGVLAGTGRTLMHDGLAHALQQRTNGLDHLGVAADHDR